MTCVSKHNSARSAVKSLLLALRTKFMFETDVFFMISLREIVKMTCVSKHNSARSAVKSLLLALRAKFKFETDVFFMILRSKIMKNTSVSKEYSAAEGGKRLFTRQVEPLASKGDPEFYRKPRPGDER